MLWCLESARLLCQLERAGISLRCSRWTIPGRALMNARSTANEQELPNASTNNGLSLLFQLYSALPDLSIDPPFLIFLTLEQNCWNTHLTITWQSFNGMSNLNSWFQLVLRHQPVQRPQSAKAMNQASRTATETLVYSQAIMIGSTPGFCMLLRSIHNYSQAGPFYLQNELQLSVQAWPKSQRPSNSSAALETGWNKPRTSKDSKNSPSHNA